MQNFVLNPQRYLMPLCLASLLVCNMVANAKTIEEMEAEAIQQKQADDRAAAETRLKEAEQKAAAKEKADEEKKAKLDAEIKRKAKEKAVAEKKAKQDAETETAVQAKEKVDAENTLQQEVNLDSRKGADLEQVVDAKIKQQEVLSSMEKAKITDQSKQEVSPASASKTITPHGGEKTMPVQVLRYGYDIILWERYTNTDTTRHRIQGFKTEFIEPSDYNKSPDVPIFQITPELIGKDYIVNKEEEIKAIVSTPYFIKATPSKREPQNFGVIYSIRYSRETAPGVWSDQYVDKTTQPYEISWCGDGVLDIAPPEAFWKSEPCDPAAEPWKSNGTCRVSPVDGKECEIISQ